MSSAEHPKATAVPHVTAEEVIATGKWVKFEKTTYVDAAGSTRTWETVKRTTRAADAEADGVEVIALLRRSLHEDCVVTLKQFRPPLGRHTLEFPAGLIDEGESASAAALRELREETGYRGEVAGVAPVTCLDPGLSNGTTQVVTVSVDGDAPENVDPAQQLGDGEFVEVVLVPLGEFQRKIDELLKTEQIVVDSKVYVFAMGMVQQASFRPNELTEQ